MYSAWSAPLNVVILANGEDALRLHKRVRCAARGLGLEITVTEQRANGKAPEVWINDDMLFTGLPRTEEVEQQLERWRLNKRS